MQAEFGAPWPALDLDEPAMVADDFGYQRQSKPAAGGLGADEGVEQILPDILGDAWPVIARTDRKRVVRP